MLEPGGRAPRAPGRSLPSAPWWQRCPTIQRRGGRVMDERAIGEAPCTPGSRTSVPLTWRCHRSTTGRRTGTVIRTIEPRRSGQPSLAASTGGVQSRRRRRRGHRALDLARPAASDGDHAVGRADDRRRSRGRAAPATRRLAPEARGVVVSGVVRNRPRPTARFIGSVFSSLASQPASDPVDDDREARRGTPAAPRGRAARPAAPTIRDRRLGQDREDGVEVVLGERAQEHALAARVGELHAAQCRRSVPSWPASQSRGTLAGMTEHAAPRTDRVDFRATSDPALQESADRGEANLLSYRELYELWERQQWAVRTWTSPRTASTGTSASTRRSASRGCTG